MIYYYNKVAAKAASLTAVGRRATNYTKAEAVAEKDAVL